MGIDFGDRRTGIAISDEAGMIAFPRETIESALVEQVAAAVVKLATAEGVSELVVGYPLNMNGTAGPRAEKTNRFIQEVQSRSDIPIRKWDERLSTKVAESALIEAGVSREKRRVVVDKLAAQIILQNYLDSRLPPEQSFDEDDDSAMW